MILLLVTLLALAAVLLVRPPHGAAARLRRAGITGSAGSAGPAGNPGPALAPRTLRAGLFPRPRRSAGKATNQSAASMTVVVQQLAALLKGGRTPARLWEEIWLVYGSSGSHGSGLSAGSSAMLGSARAAATRGTPVSDAIRRSLPSAFPGRDRESRIWSELAACFDIAEASGCPLADVLARFAAQLDVEDDADAARQTALAGPKATVSLLTWLPLLGLGLGMALGVDPLAILLGTPWGLAALAAGIGLTVTGRLWSARLVAAAAGAGVT
jgi:tight adherence protein B